MIQASILDILANFGLLAVLSGTAWIAQWGRTNTYARYFVYGLMGLSGVGLMGIGAVLLLLRYLQPGSIYAPNLEPFGWTFILVGLGAVPSLIPVIRRFLSKTVLPGLDPEAPVHAWTLYVYWGATVVMCLFLTALYQPLMMAELLKEMPLMVMAPLNAVGFVAFAFAASGWGVTKSFKEVAADLGLTRISWKIFGVMAGMALLIAIGLQVLEPMLMHWVPADKLKDIMQVVEALKPTGGPAAVMITAVVVGLFAGIGEETLFRGLMQPVMGLFPTAFLFTVIHFHYGPTVLLLELFFLGLILGAVRIRWNTTAAIVVHSFFDFFSLASSLLHHP